MEYMILVGYLPGSQLNVFDEAYNREDEYEFPNVLNDAIENGAKVLWDTYTVFEVHGMVFASVVINIEAMEILDIPIMQFDERSTGAINTQHDKRVKAIRNRRNTRK